MLLYNRTDKVESWSVQTLWQTLMALPCM